MSSKIREICWFICLKKQVHSFETVIEKKRASQAEGSFKCLPAVGALGFIKIHRPLRSLEVAERRKENGTGSLILRDCTEIQGSLLGPTGKPCLPTCLTIAVSEREAVMLEVIWGRF